MVINTKGVVATPPGEYIKEAGKYLFKIADVSLDGYSQNGNEFIKVSFDCKQIIMKDGKPTLSELSYKHQEKYCADENLIWKVAILRDALRAPESFDFDKIVGYSVIADVFMREYNKKDYANISALSYSKANDALGPIPEAKDEAEEVQSYVPVEEIDENEELPF